MATQPQITQQNKWFTKQINGKWYKTQAASPEEAKAKFAKVGGTGKSPAAAKTAQPQMSQFDRGMNESLGLDPNKQASFGEVGKAMGRGVGSMVSNAAADYTRRDPNHPYLTAVGQGLMMPLFPLHLAAKGIEGMADQIEKSVIPDVKQGNYAHALGGLAGTVTQMGLMKGAEIAGEAGLKAVAKTVTPESLRTKAGQLNVQATKTEIGDKALDPKEMAQAGRAMAEAKVIGTKMTLPRVLQRTVAQKLGVLDQTVKAADQTGVTRDTSQALTAAVDAAKQRAAALGNRKALADLDKWKVMQSNTLDPKTGKFSPRSLNMKPSELLAQSRLLE